MHNTVRSVIGFPKYVKYKCAYLAHFPNALLWPSLDAINFEQILCVKLQVIPVSDGHRGGERWVYTHLTDSELT